MFEEKKPEEMASEEQATNEPVDMFAQEGTETVTPDTSVPMGEMPAAESGGEQTMEEYEDVVPHSGKKHMILALIGIIALVLVIGGGISLVFLLKPKDSVDKAQTVTGLGGIIDPAGAARTEARDSKRMSDIKQIQSGLELFSSDRGGWYPSEQDFVGTALAEYLDPVPEDPTNAGELVYTYKALPTGCSTNCMGHELTFRLETKVGRLEPNVAHIASQRGIDVPVLSENPAVLPTGEDASGTAAEQGQGAAPVAADTDGDGLSDEDETKYKTDSNLFDTDGDGLSDREELQVYETNPLNADSDGDGFLDGEEVRNGYDPNGSGKLPTTLPQ